MQCCEDFEAHWRKSSLIRHIKSATKRCNGFKLKVDLANSIEWVLKSWDQKWRRVQGGGPGLDIADRLIAAKYLQERGLCHSLLLFDRDKPVAGLNLIVHRNEALAQTAYRNPEYDWHGAMNRLWEMCFLWARDMGFEGIFLGHGYDYKKRWAPECGRHTTFCVNPDIALVGGRVCKLIGTVRGKLRNGCRCSPPVISS